MSNVVVHDFPESLELELFQVREVLRCVLHTVLFHRTLGVVRPRDTELTLFDVIYVQVEDTEVERAVESRIDDLCTWLEKHAERQEATVCRRSLLFLARLTACQVSLSFFEKRHGTRWFSSTEERLYWEQWRLHLLLHRPEQGDEAADDARRARCAVLEDALRRCMLHTLRTVNERKDHLPPVVSPGVVSFPFEITLPLEESSYTVETLKRLVTAVRPPVNVL